MTGPEHYKEAERLADAAGKALELLADVEEFDDDEHGHLLDHAFAGTALAQVHATLANAAAAAENIRRNGAMDAGMADEWVEVCK